MYISKYLGAVKINPGSYKYSSNNKKKSIHRKRASDDGKSGI